ncbi:MAG: ATP-binding protein, partial [Actinomycetota bacterium]
PVIRILFVVFVALVAIYLVDKELKLRALTRSLVDERVLSAAFSNRLKELSALSEVSQAINRLIQVDEVLKLILDSALDLLGAEEGSVMLLDPSGDRLRVAYARSSRPETVEGAEVKLGQGIAGWVAENREPLLISGEAPPQLFEALDQKERPITSAVSVPLVSNQELFGVLNISSFGAGPIFTEYELRAVQLFAEHAAIAIRNAESFDREHQTVVRLEELDRMKTEFVASVSHELRTPLTSIIGSAKTMRQRGDHLTPEQRLDFLNVIERQGSRLLSMVEEILAAARIESGPPAFSRELMDVAGLVRQIVLGLQAAAGETPVTVEAPETMQLFGDPSVVEQVVTNLVENALKYSQTAAAVTVRLTEHPGEVRLEVIDRGVGIPEDQLESIFDRFRQLDPSSAGSRRGVGLGLFIVKNLVEAVGGAIFVDSEVGKGSVFTVRFPKRRERE